MTGSHARRIGWACAALASGPIYMIARALGALIDAIPGTVSLTFAEIVGFFVLLVPAIIGGFFASMLPLGVAIPLLWSVAAIWPPARSPAFWSAAGAVGGMSIAAVVRSDEIGASFALVVTGAASLRLARAYIDWLPPRPKAARTPAPVVTARARAAAPD